MPGSLTYTIPAPTGGWNAKDALSDMPEEDAVVLENWFPNPGKVSVRRGYRVHTTGGMGSGVVKTLAEFAGNTGTRKLVAGTNGNLYDASTYNANGTSLGSGFTSDQWQWVMMNNRLILVNGADAPQHYDGSALDAGARPFYTGIGTEANLITPAVFNQRLYFVEKNTTKIWYGGVSSIKGALTAFDLQDILRRGGYVQTIASLTQGLGGNIVDLFVVISELGEVLVYQGKNPADSTWAIVGRFYLPYPLGRRCALNLGTDLILITERGLIPLSELLQNKDIDAPEHQINNKINLAFNDAAQMYGSNFGWEGVVYHRGRCLIVNVPVVASTTSQQYVLNVSTGAWCKFTGINAATWAMFNQKPYFGGMDGKVYEWDQGTNDNGAAININCRQSFNYFGDRQHNKQFLMIRPMFVGDTAVKLNAGVDVDYRTTTPSTSVVSTGTPGATWDTDAWDTSAWDTTSQITRAYSVTGLGAAASVALSGALKDASLDYNACEIVFKTGGFL